MPFSIRPLRRLPLSYWSGFLSLIILLLQSNGQAYAEWDPIDIADNGRTTYADPDTIRRKGDLVKMWELHDFKTVQTAEAGSFLSVKSQSEYACAEERVRILAYTEFSGNMGNGNVVWRRHFGEGEWGPVEPESLGQKSWKLVCGKK
jgi:hypothetical protein